ncbi:MAG: CpsD/CapB family tyrosine-protein kinase [Oscillospiraceae bacterium]|jgi:capsular exopolysaccharide synthesis family protein
MNRSKKNELQQLKIDRSHLLTVNSDFFVQESYKRLRTNVFFSLMAESDCKSILITSASQNEGKSIIAANLAISYAQAGNRVLLLDCDLRRPKLSQLLDLYAPVGLSNLLMDPELLDSALLNSHVPGLSVILAGDIPPTPSELLGSIRMKQLLERLKENFDYIIMDTPPITAVTDTTVLVPQSSGVLFIVRSRYSDHDSVAYALSQLRHANANILGFVLNGSNVEKSNKHRYKKFQPYDSYSQSASS